MKSKSTLESKQRGIALTEFAIVSFVVLILLLGVADFSYIFIQHSKVTNAAREIGRDAAILESSDCYTEARANLLQRLDDLGFSTVDVGGGFVDNAALGGASFLQLVVNVEIDALTSALSFGGTSPHLPHVRSYMFLIEHPEVCAP